MVGLVLCGVQVIWFPDTQYEYFRLVELVSPKSVTSFPEGVYLPVADRSVDRAQSRRSAG